MRNTFVTLILIILSTLASNAELRNEFSYANEKFAGVNLNYRTAVINPESNKPEVVVIYLHGGSSRGSDNELQLQSQAVEDIYNFLKNNDISARMIVPQAPVGCQWEDGLIPALKELSDKYVYEGSECYILGGSMGGYGVWNMLSAYPNYFTGAMPVACNTPKNQVEKYVGTRIYSVMGGRDPNRNFSAIQSFFNRLGTTEEKYAILDLENDWNHRETCDWSFSPQRLKWLFNIIESSEIGPSVDQSNACSQIFNLRGNLITNPVSGHIYIMDRKAVLYVEQ